MRYSLARRHRCAFITAAIAAASSTLTGCDQLKQFGSTSDNSAALLKQGSSKVCVSTDVQSALTKLIITSPAERNSGQVGLEQKTKATKAVAIVFEQTTLQSFDQSVSKVTCDTTVKLSSRNASEKRSFHLSYVISPSAESADEVVVKADTDEARAFADDLVEDEINTIAAESYSKMVDQEAAEAKRTLLKTLNPRWLAGAWIAADQPAEACGNGAAIWFEPNNALEGALGQGRWSLKGDKLHLVAQSTNNESFDITETITQADAISFTARPPSGAEFSLRRCSRQETETLPTADGPSSTGAGA